MTRKLLECLCPCFFTENKDHLALQMPLIKKVSKLEFPLRQHSPFFPHNKQHEEVPHFCLAEPQQKRRSTMSCKGQEPKERKSQKTTKKLAESVRSIVNAKNSQQKPNSYDQLQSFKSFRDDHRGEPSFHKSSSIMKRSVKLLRFPTKKGSHHQSENFQSVVGGLMIAPCMDSNYKEVMDHLLDWVTELEQSPSQIGQSQRLDFERIKRIALLEVQTKVQEFEYFTEDHNTIFKNADLQMQVDLKDFPKIFQANIYATLCRFRINCSVLSFFTLFNTPECQTRLCNFTPYELVTRQPNLLLSTKQLSNMLINKREVVLLKFNELIAEAVGDMQKKMIVEIDRDISGSGGAKNCFKRITCVNKQSDLLEVEIYTQTTMNFRPGVDEKAYFQLCYRKFADYLLKNIKKITKA